LRIIFMGSPDFSAPVLHALHDAGHEIICVYTQPPRPAGRGHKERPCPVHAVALKMNIPVRNPVNFKAVEDCVAFAALEADIAVVVAYGLLLPKAVLSAPRLGCINVHASLLPRWRGAAPIQRAILAGDDETGVCIMAMDEGLDTGAVYLRHSVAITEKTTGGSLHDELSIIGAQSCVEALESIASGVLQPETQPKEGVTYAKKLSPAEARMDWEKPADELARAVKAFDPWPGTWFEHNGERIKLFAAHAESAGRGEKAEAGEILDSRPAIACGDGTLVLERLQRAGRKAQDAADFLRGYKFEVGEILS
jgi:methionyl-tRNA formyltransferase